MLQRKQFKHSRGRFHCSRIIGFLTDQKKITYDCTMESNAAVDCCQKQGTSFCNEQVNITEAFGQIQTSQSHVDDFNGRLKMLVTESICWRLFTLFRSFLWIESVTNICHRSLVSQRCQQYILSPTPVANIEVADKIKKFRSLEHMCL